jgi:hypothetical protein
VDPVPDPLLLRKSGIAGNRLRASGSVARNSDHKTTEAVSTIVTSTQKFADRHDPVFGDRKISTRRGL